MSDINALQQLNQNDRRVKIFVVDIDDDDRERVLSFEADYTQVNVDYEYSNVHDGWGAVYSFRNTERVNFNCQIARQNDGTYYKIENFKEEYEEETS